MSLEKVSDILKMADKAKTSAIAYNCTDYNTIYSAITVAEEMNKPVICMLYPEHAQKNNWCNPKSFSETVRSIARNVRVPVGLHLDHCTDPDYILAAVKDGFTSVMYDGSMLSVEENIKNTRAIADKAHAMGAEVEAELGRVGFASTVTDQSDTDMYTKPEVAAAFCGVLLVVKPTGQNMTLAPALIGLLGGFGAGFAYTMVHLLGTRGVPGPFIVFCFSLFSCVVTGPMMLADFVPMTAAQLGVLLLVGLSAAFAQFSITAAYTCAPARESHGTRGLLGAAGLFVLRAGARCVELAGVSGHRRHGGGKLSL